MNRDALLGEQLEPQPQVGDDRPVDAQGHVDLRRGEPVGVVVHVPAPVAGVDDGSAARPRPGELHAHGQPLGRHGVGQQEHGHRAGTENIAAIVGFGAAVREARVGLAKMEQIAALRDRFEAAILDLVPDAVIFGRAAPRLPNTTYFAIPGIKAETAQIAFDLEGVALSAGSACSSGKVGPSHVLAAMGHGAYGGALRVSIGHQTSDEDLAAFAGALRKLIARRVVKAA